MKQYNHWWKRLAALILTLAMLLSVTAWASFDDVSEDSELGEALAWAVDAGVARGTGDGKFEPDAPCTKAALATFLWRASGAPDMGEDTAWYSDAVAWAAQAGLFSADADVNEPVGSAEFTALMALLGVPFEGSGAVVTRGEVIIALYTLAGKEPTLGDGTPWVNYCLRENIAAVTEQPTSPKDDFYLYSNYEWAKGAEIPVGYASAGPFVDVADMITEKSKAVLTDKTLTGDDAKLVQHLYNACLDWDARNAVGIKPIREIVDKIKAVSTLDELSALLCDPNASIPSMVSIDADIGFNDSTMYLTSVAAKSLLLSDSAEYQNRTELGRRYEEGWGVLSEKMLTRMGYTAEEAKAIYRNALAFETKLAPSIYTAAEKMAPDYLQRINNEMSRAELEKLCTSFPLTKYIDSKGYPTTSTYVVAQPAFLKQLDQLYTAENLETLKEYLILYTAIGYATYLDREAYDAYLAFYSSLIGSDGSQPDEDIAFTIVRSMLKTPMDRAYLAKYDSTKMKQDITRICEEAVAYYRTMLQSEDWLSEATRKKAIEKLDAITINAVYPEKWRDYSGLSLDGLGYFDSIRAIGRFDRKYTASLPGTKVDKELWPVDILDTNAYYDPQGNSINIILGILGGAFYREDMSSEELYAAIGGVIGHEISHAFDTVGAQFDAQGNMTNWWTDEDYAAFTARANKLAAYYDKMIAFNGYAVKGQNIQTEAIADMAGVKCMLGLLEQKGSVDYKMFFTAYAKVWRQLMTRETAYSNLTQDSHPLHYLRVNATLQQFDQFLKTYDIKEGDGMYLAPADRVLVW